MWKWPRSKAQSLLFCGEVQTGFTNSLAVRLQYKDPLHLWTLVFAAAKKCERVELTEFEGLL